MRYRTILASRLLFAALIVPQGVCGQSCANFTIHTADDLRAARNCPQVYGDVLIGPELTEVNLDGVETIGGNLETISICRGEEPGCKRDWPLRTVSSATLTTVDGRLLMGWNDGLNNVTLPKLRAVRRQFNLHTLPNLTYLDVSLLESVGRFKIDAPILTTMKHEALRNVTGEGETVKDIYVHTGLENMDSIFQHPLSVDNVVLEPSPSVGEINFGLANTTELIIRGPWLDTKSGVRFEAVGGNTTIAFGGPESKTVHVGRIYYQNVTVGLRRRPDLEQLTAGTFQMEGNGYLETLNLPFDELEDLRIQETDTLRWLSNSPRAAQWTNFSMTLASENKALNLSSEYLADESGNMVRSWYWPQKDIKAVYITAILGDDFFDSFLEYQASVAKSSNRQRVLEGFRLEQSGNGVLNCAPFDKLNSQGVFSSYGCVGKSTSSSSSSFTLKPQRAVVFATLGAILAVAPVIF